MVGWTVEEERALEASALEAYRKIADCGMSTDADLGDWEQAFWGGEVDILVNRKQYVAAVISQNWGRAATLEEAAVITLVGDPMLTFLADQIHRCSAGALNHRQPVREVVLGGS